MKKIYSISILILLPLSIHFCTDINSIEYKDSKNIKIVIQTLNEYSKGIPSEIFFEQRDCEYDFLNPATKKSNSKGIIVLNVTPGYLQFYVKDFLNESYTCSYYRKTDTIRVFAAPIPTFIKVSDLNGRPAYNHKVVYFPNTSGNCLLEETYGSSETNTNQDGIAKIYLPQNDTYKIQVGVEVQCFQPSQQMDTLNFLIKD